MKKNIGIVGSGIVGLLTAFRFARLNHRVTIFEKESRSSKNSCSFIAGGMIAPYCELINSDKKIFDLGQDSLYKWKEIVASLKNRPFFKTNGSLLVAQKNERTEIETISSRINRYTGINIEIISRNKINKLEPGIDSEDLIGIYFRNEGQIDCHEIIDSLIKFLISKNCDIRFNTRVTNIKKNTVFFHKGKGIEFDHVIECSGLNSINKKNSLRGVRGEIILAEAKNVKISRPIRLNHFRYPVYVIPRERNNFLIGATVIENEDFSPVSIRSVLELLNSAIFICKGFSEARILRLSTNCRPAYIDNLPKISITNDFICANGMYRHGYLLSPLISELIVDYCINQKKNENLNYIYN